MLDCQEVAAVNSLLMGVVSHLCSLLTAPPHPNPQPHPPAPPRPGLAWAEADIIFVSVWQSCAWSLELREAAAFTLSCRLTFPSPLISGVKFAERRRAWRKKKKEK